MSEEDNRDHHSMVLEWEPQGRVYVVTVPELPGCRTHGRSLEEAVRHGQEVIDFWIEAARDAQEPVPLPRSFDLDSIESSSVGQLILSGEDDDDALPYRERTVRRLGALVAEARRTS